MLNLTNLRKVLHYDPETGAFTWLRVRSGVSTAGKAAGSVFTHPQTDHRYLIISVFCQRYRAHRLAVFYMTGQWPSDEVDHKDGDGLNNRWDNLRVATRSQNHANSKLARNNVSGFKGVRQTRGRYRARIAVEKKRIELGTFDTAEEAHQAYCIAARRFFGLFARSE